jgi:hypothetical protein
VSRLLVAQPALTVPGWVKEFLWRRAQAVPSLDLRFADNKSLADAVTGQQLVTITRAGSGTFTDSAGTLQTAATDVPRFDHNPTTGESLGLLVEEARTNLLVGSAAPATQIVTVTAVAHTLHFTGTGTITLTGASTAGPLVGTGTGEANRVSLTFTPTAGSLTLTVSGTVTNAQLEAGAFRTSYILNVSTPLGVTRSADVVSITGSAFSSWYNATEGTIYHQGSTAAAGNFFSIDDSTVSNRITSYFPAATAPAFFIATGGATQANISSSAITAGSTFAQANAYKANDFVIVTNGGTVSTDTSGSVPTVNRMVIGANNFGTANINGTIRRLVFWPQALPSRLQAITQ